MPLLDQIRADKLVELARARFDAKLEDAEEKVLRDSASSEDSPVPDGDFSRPEVRAAFIRWLATDAEAASQIDPKGLRVSGASIMGPLELQGSRISVIFNCWRCTFSGKIDLRSAETRGILLTECAAPQTGIRGDRLLIHGPFLFRRCQFGGEIRMLGARIEGNLDGGGARLNSRRNSLSLDRAEIAGNVVLSYPDAEVGDVPDETQRFTSLGEIRLHNVRVGGQLKFSGAKLATGGRALVMDGAEIQGTAYLDKGFEALGIVALAGAKISGDLVFSGARVATVYCANVQIHRDFIWQRVQEPGQVRLFLGGARMNNLRDDRASWPNVGEIDLDGLIYEELTLHIPPGPEDIKNNRYAAELPFVARERIEWLMLQPPDRRIEPQPWFQLAKLLDAKGDRRDAKQVIFQFRCLRARTQKNWWVSRRWAIFFAWLEEAPLRILRLIAATLVIGSFIYAGADRSGAMIPSVRILPNGEIRPVSDHYPPFQPVVYSLENGLPLVRLGMDDKWIPDRRHIPRPWFPGHRWLDWLSVFNSYWFLAISRWVLILSGWFQATILAAALADRFRK